MIKYMTNSWWCEASKRLHTKGESFTNLQGGKVSHGKASGKVYHRQRMPGLLPQYDSVRQDCRHFTPRILLISKDFCKGWRIFQVLVFLQGLALWLRLIEILRITMIMVDTFWDRKRVFKLKTSSILGINGCVLTFRLKIYDSLTDWSSRRKNLQILHHLMEIGRGYEVGMASIDLTHSILGDRVRR